jgi:hypothetical protein
VAAKEHPPARFAPQRGERSSEQLGLIVPATANPGTAGGRPGDDVDLGCIEPTAELTGEMYGEVAAIAVLQPDDQFFAQTTEFGCCENAGRGGHR